MELSGDEDPEKIKKLIMAIREGLQEEIVSNDSSQGDEEKEYVFTPRTISPLSRKLLLTQQ